MSGVDAISYNTNMQKAQVFKLGHLCDLFTLTCCAFNKGKG